MRTNRSIPSQILDLIGADALPAGDHLTARQLADRLCVSRSPVNEALSLRAGKGVLQRQPNRGYFLVRPIGNRVRRLLSYRSMQDRSRYVEHCHQHLGLLDLLERGRNEEAAEAMHAHLDSTLRNVQKITGLLKT